MLICSPSPHLPPSSPCPSRSLCCHHVVVTSHCSFVIKKKEGSPQVHSLRGGLRLWMSYMTCSSCGIICSCVCSHAFSSVMQKSVGMLLSCFSRSPSVVIIINELSCTVYQWQLLLMYGCNLNF